MQTHSEDMPFVQYIYRLVIQNTGLSYNQEARDEYVRSSGVIKRAAATILGDFIVSQGVEAMTLMSCRSGLPVAATRIIRKDHLPPTYPLEDMLEYAHKGRRYAVLLAHIASGRSKGRATQRLGDLYSAACAVLGPILYVMRTEGELIDNFRWSDTEIDRLMRDNGDSPLSLMVTYAVSVMEKLAGDRQVPRLSKQLFPGVGSPR